MVYSKEMDALMEAWINVYVVLTNRQAMGKHRKPFISSIGRSLPENVSVSIKFLNASKSNYFRSIRLLLD